MRQRTRHLDLPRGDRVGENVGLGLLPQSYRGERGGLEEERQAEKRREEKWEERDKLEREKDLVRKRGTKTSSVKATPATGKMARLSGGRRERHG